MWLCGIGDGNLLGRGNLLPEFESATNPHRKSQCQTNCHRQIIETVENDKRDRQLKELPTPFHLSVIVTELSQPLPVEELPKSRVFLLSVYWHS
jgi:hypothetical protein